MKKVNLFFWACLIATFVFSNSIIAQTSANNIDDPVEKSMCCKGKTYYNIPDLTDEQKKKIDDLQVVHLKEVNQIKAQLNEKNAHLRTLQLADKPDNSAINKTIDEITMLKSEMMKKHESHRQAVRALLNDKQKVIFDAKGGCHHGKGDGSTGSCKSKGCKSNCKAKECSGSQKAKCCSAGTTEHQPVKGKGCCHR